MVSLKTAPIGVNSIANDELYESKSVILLLNGNDLEIMTVMRYYENTLFKVCLFFDSLNSVKPKRSTLIKSYCMHKYYIFRKYHTF